MSRHIFSASIIILILSWYIMFGLLDHDYDVKQAFVQDTVYSYTQVAAKKGILYSSVFNEMDNMLNRFGDYEIYFKAEKFEGGASDPVVLTGPSVLDTDLRAAGYDLITINVVYLKPHPVSSVFNLPLFASINTDDYEAYLYGRSCLYIQ